MEPDLMVVPEPTSLVPTGFVPKFADPEVARAAAKKSAEVRNAKRVEGQHRRRDVAKAVLGEVTEAALDAVESDALKHKSNEELADMQVRRMARVVLLGGEAFMPTSLSEATQSAHTWAQIAKAEAYRKGKIKADEPEDDSAAKQAAVDLTKLARKLASVKRPEAG